MDTEPLIPFEQAVLDIVQEWGTGVHSVTILEALQKRFGRAVSPDDISIAVDYLEKRGFVHTYVDETTRKRMVVAVPPAT